MIPFRNLQFALAGLLAIGAIFNHFTLDQENTIKARQLDEKTRSGTVQPRNISRNSKETSSLYTSTSEQIRHLLQLSKSPLSESLFYDTFFTGEDGTWSRQNLALAGHTREEVMKFLASIESPPLRRDSIKNLEIMIGLIFPSQDDPGTQIKKALAENKGKGNYLRPFMEWLHSDFDSARTWLDEQLASNSLKGEELEDPTVPMIIMVTEALFITAPLEAIEYYQTLSTSDQSRAQQNVGYRLANSEPKQQQAFFDKVSDPELRSTVLGSVISAQAGEKSKEKILTYSQTLSLTEKETNQVFENIISDPENFAGDNINKRVDWIKEHSGQDDLTPYLDSLIYSSYFERLPELRTWVENQNESLQQKFYPTLTQVAAMNQRNFKDATAFLLKIEDPAVQRKSYQENLRWLGEIDRQKWDTQLTKVGADPKTLKQ